MPVAQINILEGRTDEQKEMLIHEVTDAIVRSLGAPVESVRVIVSTSNGDEEVHPDSICSCKSLRLRNVLVFLPLGYRYLST